jgi:hypothetical protein
MLLSRLRALAVLTAAALTLSACFVISANRIDGSGPDADPALIGTWRGLNEDGTVEKDVFLHVIAHKTGEGLGLTMVDKDSTMLLDGTTVQAGPYRYLNATFKQISGASDDEALMLGLHIIRYEVKGKKLSLWLMDPAQVGDAIQNGKLKGTIEGSGMSKTVRLTASSEDLNAFFSKQDAAQYFQDKAVTLVRFEN